MQDTQIILSALWSVTLFIYIYGDILRILSGDSMPGKVKVDGKKFTSIMWVGAAVMMLLPISMIFLTLILPYQVNRWLNIIMAGVWFIINAMGIRTYPGAYDRFLLAVSLILNVLVIWYAWGWG